MATQPRPSTPRDKSGAILAFLTFLVGLGMVGGAFYLAYEMFRMPPNLALQIIPGQTMDLGKTVGALLQILVKVVALILMTIFGSVVANRGIKLYEAGRPRLLKIKEKAKKEAASRETGE